MKHHKSLAMLLASLMIGVAGAASAQQAAPQSSAPTRAEVLADLQIWQQSGMADLEDHNHASEPFYTARYQKAQAEYERLRASPQFATLVNQIATAHGWNVQQPAS
jgi:hypothetical protein